MGKLVLYGLEPSPPVRACKLTLEALGLQYDYRLVNLHAGENKTKDYLRKNSQHTVPTLEDDGKFLWDSHAICAYLVRKYGKEHGSLYPSDYLDRAVVDQRLHFETGVLFQGCIRPIMLPLLYHKPSEMSRAQVEAIYEAYDHLEAFMANDGLGEKAFLCGASLTIADFSCVSSVSSLLGLAPIEATRYPRLAAWMERLAKLPYYDQANGQGAQMLIDMFSDKVKRIA